MTVRDRNDDEGGAPVFSCRGERVTEIDLRWEWRLFDADRRAHLYRVAELDRPRLELLLPWCLLRAPFPLEHDRAGISRHVVVPRRGWTCPACAVHVRARVRTPHRHVRRR
ncbi:hypothetical protein [Amycolatopsis sp. lyj-346]|uniref:hypothetical protein n=1 Tax=Amycolatopsis sp. lyj-346 TaxID=2789289 RepID=UPI00397A0844